MISLDKSGGRTIHLFIPFEYSGKKIESIVLAPPCLGHSLRWTDGDWKTSVALLVELAGVDEAVIRSLRYPDADRVMEAFLTMLPNDIRMDISEGRVPTKKTQAEMEGAVADKLAEATRQLEEVTARVGMNGNGGDDDHQPFNMRGPGVPLPGAPETGFDLSDEP